MLLLQICPPRQFQNENGPCPLLANTNILLLRGELRVHPAGVLHVLTPVELSKRCHLTPPLAASLSAYTRGLPQHGERCLLTRREVMRVREPLPLREGHVRHRPWLIAAVREAPMVRFIIKEEQGPPGLLEYREGGPPDPRVPSRLTPQRPFYPHMRTRPQLCRTVLESDGDEGTENIRETYVGVGGGVGGGVGVGTGSGVFLEGL